MPNHITVDFQHPANAGILAHLRKGSQDAVLPDGSPEDHPDPYMRLGTHPDLVARLWKDITTLLPEKCQWIINNRPVLVHPTSGIIFGYAEGTLAYALRLPPAEYEEAIQKGAARTHKYLHSTFDLEAVGEGWVFGKWRQDEPRWCLAAYEFAGEGKETNP
jgi:hypothetical protein